MDKTSPGHETVFRTKQQRECTESHMVLDAVGIGAEINHREGWWSLEVQQNDATIAIEELEAYWRENVDRSDQRPASIPLYGGATTAVLVYAGVIILLAILTSPWGLGLGWLAAGRMQAGRVMAGEWWRVVTALTLHLDVGHLLANLLFGGVFGFLAGRILGGGVAWLAIVLAGATGNFMNAVVQPPAHLSIGASTAVFAALGILVSHALRPRTAIPEKFFKRWSPLVGGVVLLAMTGVGGERTDVVAHLTGFLAGLLIGWGGCRLPHDWLASREVQKWAGFAGLAIVASAWLVALVSA